MTKSLSKISAKQLEEAIQLYPRVIQRSYERQIKTEKKQVEAVERDDWRYRKLPNEVRQDGGMTLEQLEKLVQWKITHGTSRPFLPAMIRKNDPAMVLKATGASAKTLSSLKDDTSASEAVELAHSAMAEASKLTGVGPATASLVLAIYKPDLVPFFQDELWAWCFPEKAGTKLKYDKKEYESLFRHCWDIKQSLGNAASMVDLEKASFVLQHVDLLTDDEKSTLGESQPEDKSTARETPKGLVQDSKQEKNAPAKAVSKRTIPPVGDAAKQDNTIEGPRRSKRAKR